MCVCVCGAAAALAETEGESPVLEEMASLSADYHDRSPAQHTQRDSDRARLSAPVPVRGTLAFFSVDLIFNTKLYKLKINCSNLHLTTSVFNNVVDTTARVL